MYSARAGALTSVSKRWGTRPFQRRPTTSAFCQEEEAAQAATRQAGSLGCFLSHAQLLQPARTCQPGLGVEVMWPYMGASVPKCKRLGRTQVHRHGTAQPQVGGDHGRVQ
jgi:hypothetical protein